MELNNEFEIKGIIPIIGIISSGKSTFLGALLGTDLLEVGVSTTTEFILFIKHNNNNDYLFQKIKPLGNGNNKGLFIKEGEVISGIDEIKDKIKELNEEFNNKKDVGINDLLYMLEMPISTIKNDFIKNNYCFLDLPGLNEANLLDKYSDIFERLKKLLKFEIFIFDSTQIEQDNAEKILINLNKKKWLVKENNLFILNKIDQCKKEKKQILDIFSFYFYNNFGDGAKKKNINNGLYIDIYSKNIFIPLNSLLFKSENVLNTRFDFSSLLEKELFTFIEENQFNNSFLYYLNEKLKVQKENYNELENLNLINDENNIDEDEEEDIFKGICNLKELIDKIKPPGFKEIDWDNINEGSDNFKLFKNIFLLYKKEKWRINYSNEFKEIEKYFINFEKEENEKGNIENQIYEDLKDIDALNSSLTSSLKQINMSHNSLRDSFIKLIKTEREKNRIMKEEENNEDNEKKIKILKQLNNFISNYLNEYINENMKIKPEDRKDNFKVFTNNINEIKEKLKVKKIRVSFIGNVSVGKSSILNCIIGDDILPIGITQCTYRGIIIKYKDEEEFKLYKTKLHEESSIYYYYFIDDKTPVCKGKNLIKSFLNNKNKDIDVTDEDAFLVITGRLKFFEAFEENDKLLSLKNIIEFIDLPGHNNSKNEFIKRGYYNKILRYTNCCIYVNIPSSIDDEDVQQVFEDQLRSDKDKIYKNLRNQIIDSSVFVINKSDLLILDNKIPKIEKNKNSEKLIKIIEKIYLKLDKEKADKSGEKIISNKKKSDKIQGVRTIKICFFSSEKYFDYLQIYEKYITLVNNNPKKLWEKWYNSWIKTSGVIDFGQYVSEELSKDIIKIKLYINKEDDILKNNLLIAYNQLKQTYKLNDYQNINEIISTIAKINQYLKNYEILEKFYIYMINNNPSEFWEKISYNFTLKDKEKDINLKDFLNNKIKEDKNMLIKTNIWDKYKNNKNNGIKNKKISFQEEKELDLKKNFVKKMKNSFRNILSKYNIELDEGSINNILNDIFEISEALEKKSLFYSNSFFISLRKAIIISNDIQNDNFKNRINKEFLQNLDKLFEKNIELKKIKEKNEINNFISEYKKNNPISEIIKIIEYKIVFISNTKNNIFFELSKILNEEIKDHDKKIKEAKDKLNQQIKEKKDEIRATLDINEKNQLSQELKLLEKENILVFAFNIMVDKMKIIIEEAGQKISKELDSLILEIKNKIEERKKLILNESDSLVSLLEGNLSFFYDVSSAIKNSLIAIFSSFLRGSSVAITSSIVIGGTAGTSFGLPGIIIGVGIGILAGAIELLIKNLRKGKKYEGVLLKIKDQILSNIEDKFNNIITDLTDYKNELENELQSKLTIELNKIKPIDYGRIKEKYEEEKQSILAEMEKIS